MRTLRRKPYNNKRSSWRNVENRTWFLAHSTCRTTVIFIQSVGFEYPLGSANGMMADSTWGVACSGSNHAPRSWVNGSAAAVPELLRSSQKVDRKRVHCRLNTKRYYSLVYTRMIPGICMHLMRQAEHYYSQTNKQRNTT